MAVLGNQGIVKLIYQGYQKIAAPGGAIDDAGFFTRLGWALQGFYRDNPGRKPPTFPLAIGTGTQAGSSRPRVMLSRSLNFPTSHVLYADLHAHLVALPVTLLALTFPHRDRSG